MEYPESHVIQASADQQPRINDRSIETMNLEELHDAAIAVSLLTQAIEQRRAQLIEHSHGRISDVKNNSLALATTTETTPSDVVDKAKEELQQFYQSPIGRAIYRALTNAYQNPGTPHSITKPGVPLQKDTLASVIKYIVPEMARTLVLDGKYDLDEALKAPVKHIKGYGGLSSANAAAARLIAGYHGTVSHLTVKMQEASDEESSLATERYLFDLALTKQPTGKPAFTDLVTMEFTIPEPTSTGSSMEYRLISRGKSSRQETYEDSARRIGRTLISQNIAAPLSGGRVSPR
jgi:hypothetical protein